MQARSAGAVGLVLSCLMAPSPARDHLTPVRAASASRAKTRPFDRGRHRSAVAERGSILTMRPETPMDAIWTGMIFHVGRA
jgi:hypothetical protein